MKINHFFQVATHWDHLLAPNDPRAGFSKEVLWKRVAGVTLLVIGVAACKQRRWGQVAIGCALLFYGCKAYTKVINDEARQKKWSRKDEALQSEEENNKVLQKIMTCSKKVGIVLGRRRFEYLPQEEGWQWVSLSIDPHYRDDDVPQADRWHLDMDFNEITNLIKLEGLFDKIVVDWSTGIFAECACWFQFRGLLKKNQNAVLITQTIRNRNILPAKFRAGQSYDFWNGCLSISYTDGQLIRSLYLDKVRVECEKEFSEVLMNLFEKVEIIRNCPLPTREGFQKPPDNTHYFILTGPKRFIWDRCTLANAPFMVKILQAIEVNPKKNTTFYGL